MSRTIAQAAGGKRFVWLLAILAVFTVIAMLRFTTNVSAAAVDDDVGINTTDTFDALAIGNDVDIGHEPFSNSSAPLDSYNPVWGSGANSNIALADSGSQTVNIGLGLLVVFIVLGSGIVVMRALFPDKGTQSYRHRVPSEGIRLTARSGTRIAATNDGRRDRTTG